jgi:hypothetical protein
MQGMRHETGRGMMRDALIESFQASRTAEWLIGALANHQGYRR